MRTLLDNRVGDYFDAEQILFCLSQYVCMFYQWVYQLFDMDLFGVVVIFLQTPFCVVKFGK